MFAGQFQAGGPPVHSKQLQLLRALQQTNAIESEVTSTGNESEIWLRFHPLAASATGPAEQMAEVESAAGHSACNWTG